MTLAAFLDPRYTREPENTKTLMTLQGHQSSDSIIPEDLIMTPPLLQSTDIHNKFEDLSGVDSASYLNPYDALIEASDNHPVRTLPLQVLTSTTTKSIFLFLFKILSNQYLTSPKAKLQARYSTHRSTRNAQQREKLPLI